MESLEERFHNKVAKSDGGCWNWTAASNNLGYGWINIAGRMTKAHRVSYELHCGEIKDGMNVLHKCDNPRCVNPDHLFLGTQADNMRDMAAKGRKAKPPRDGVRNGRSKLTESDVSAIRATTGTNIELARRFGVSDAQISNIRARRAWVNV